MWPRGPKLAYCKKGQLCSVSSATNGRLLFRGVSWKDSLLTMSKTVYCAIVECRYSTLLRVLWDSSRYFRSADIENDCGANVF